MKNSSIKIFQELSPPRTLKMHLLINKSTTKRTREANKDLQAPQTSQALTRSKFKTSFPPLASLKMWHKKMYQSKRCLSTQRFNLLSLGERVMDSIKVAKTIPRSHIQILRYQTLTPPQCLITAPRTLMIIPVTLLSPKRIRALKQTVRQIL